LEEWQDFREGDFTDVEAEEYVARRMRMIARRAGARYCRREIAGQLGDKPDDAVFCSNKHLQELFEHFYALGVTERPPVSGGESITSSVSDPSAGGGWLVSLLDVERGLRELPKKYRARLKMRFKDLGEYDLKQIATMVGNLAVAPGKRRRIEKHLGTDEKQMGM